MSSRLSHSRMAAISSGAASCSARRVVQPEDQQRVGVRQDPLVDRQPVAGLVDALEHGDRMAGHFAHRLLEVERGAVEQLQRARDALEEVHLVPLRSPRTPARPPAEPRSWSRSGCPAPPGPGWPPTGSSRSSRCSPAACRDLYLRGTWSWL